MASADMRVRAWTRSIKHSLFPNSQAEGPLSHRLNDALRSLADRNLRGKDDRKIFLDRFPTTGQEFVSSSRWTDWWNAKTQPTLDKIEVIEKIIPSSKRWLEPVSRRQAKHPMQTLFHAIDLWGSTEPRRAESMKLLMDIGDFWAPRCKGEGTHQLQRMGWYLAPFSARHFLPPEIATEHYRSLEPASILESMLWTGSYFGVHNTEYFRLWLMDLVAAALATDALLTETGYGQDAVDLGGESGLISAKVLWIFVHRASFFDPTVDEEQAKRALVAALSMEAGRLPSDTEFLEMMSSSVCMFKTELAALGVTSEDIQKLDSTNFWIETRSTIDWDALPLV